MSEWFLPNSKGEIKTVQPPDFEGHVLTAFNEALNLLISKHKDYGPKNISNAPGGPELGLLVRLSDKLARLEHLRQKGGEPNHEAVRDTWLDIACYGIIGLLVTDGKWPV